MHFNLELRVKGELPHDPGAPIEKRVELSEADEFEVRNPFAAIIRLENATFCASARGTTERAVPTFSICSMSQLNCRAVMISANPSHISPFEAAKIPPRCAKSFRGEAVTQSPFRSLPARYHFIAAILQSDIPSWKPLKPLLYEL